MKIKESLSFVLSSWLYLYVCDVSVSSICFNEVELICVYFLAQIRWHGERMQWYADCIHSSTPSHKCTMEKCGFVVFCVRTIFTINSTWRNWWMQLYVTQLVFICCGSISIGWRICDLSKSSDIYRNCSTNFEHVHVFFHHRFHAFHLKVLKHKIIIHISHEGSGFSYKALHLFVKQHWRYSFQKLL